MQEVIDASGITPEVVDPRKFTGPLDPGSVHQGAALEVKPLNWGALEDVCIGAEAPRVVLLDRVTDPHNVGAILRSAEVFGASALSVPAITQRRDRRAGENRQRCAGAATLSACTQSGRCNSRFAGHGLSRARARWLCSETLETAVAGKRDRAIALVLGAEGPGLREKTKETVDGLVRIDAAGGFGSLNVSNAAAVSLYALRQV